MKIKFVDAAKIRNTLDTDFSGYGTAEFYLYIPKGEIWLDKCLRDETRHYVALTKLYSKMRKEPFRKIREAAKKLLTIKNVDGLIERKRERVGKYTVVYIDGGSVRAHLDPYFELGGHHLVYDYVPKNEIWVDAKTEPKDWKYTVIHEIEEHKRMSGGMSYSDAHDYAMAAERVARRHDGVANFFR
ncbi:MAG: hypothetical protein WCJ29_03660 [bacterium]